ncbi:unnamed protein product [Blumeria hordei]|uniref:Fungal-type protein kinase domain-containing protein n=1 Tax=Blumeria hordei TaxID=2867405 RepID=A0A383USI5_BLUHO|nr:unnamed protein product [Blumeria hordei]
MPPHSALPAHLAENPIRPVLERFQAEIIQKDSRSIGDSHFVTKADPSNRVAIRRLFHDLSQYYLRFSLKDNESPYMPLSFLSSLISIEISNLSVFQHLIHAIEQDYEEAFILQTCINLCGILSCSILSPVPFQQVPSSPTKSSSSVPITVSQQFKKFPPNPTKVIEDELGNKSYIKIRIFWQRFFEEKSWSDQTKRIWESYKDYKKNVNPKYCRLNLAEQGIWDWLASFNNLFLSQLYELPSLPSEHFPTLERRENDLPLRGKFCLLTTVGGRGQDEVQGQLDFHINSIDLNSEEDDWKHVRVVGGLSTKPAEGRRKVKFVELATYVRKIFCAQPLRRFVHGFCLFDKEIEFWLIDRTGAYSSGFISIENDEQVLVRAICSYLLMSDEELGLDTTIRHVDRRSVITICDDESGQTREIEIDSYPMVSQEELISSGTTCYRSIDDKLLIKYAWRQILSKQKLNV